VSRGACHEALLDHHVERAGHVAVRQHRAG
jgi:hypothetical protein